MAKQITFTYDGKDYILEYTRRTVKQMEDEGFNVTSVDTKPLSVLPDLFAGAFKAHHRFLKRDVIDEIFKNMPNKEKLISTLSEMYYEPIATLMEEPEATEKNVDWTVSQ